MSHSFKRPWDPSRNENSPTRKSDRLGLFRGPMASPTVALVGLSPRDAVEIVERKLNRALQADSREIRLVYDHTNKKLMRLVEEFLKSTSFVREFHEDEDHAGVLWVSLD
jgi:dsDNA-specific endonuclease/ATPase MutS2